MLPEEVPQAYHPQGSTIALHSAMGSSLLPYSVHAKATGTLLMQQTDKGAWDRLSNVRVTEPQMSNWFCLASSAPTQASSFICSLSLYFIHPFISFIYSFYVC